MKAFNELLAEAKTRFGDDERRLMVMEDAFNSAQNDNDYLWNLIEWAYRDYQQDDFDNDFIQQGLNE